MLAVPPHCAALDGNGLQSRGEAVVRSADPDCLRVEFFGAAGAGKTTVALALSAELEKRGLPVRLVQFGRASAPGVPLQPQGGLPRQLAKLAGGVRALVTDGERDPAFQQLETILPPGDRIRAIRIRRYAADLCRAWRENQRPGEVLVLDQGYLTLICSLSLLSEPIDRSALASALALVPRADLLIHVEAPAAALEGRLRERVRRRRALERLLGTEVEHWLRQREIAAILDGIIAESGRAPVRVRSVGRADIDAAVRTIAGEIVSLMGGVGQ